MWVWQQIKSAIVSIQCPHMLTAVHCRKVTSVILGSTKSTDNFGPVIFFSTWAAAVTLHVHWTVKLPKIVYFCQIYICRSKHMEWRWALFSVIAEMGAMVHRPIQQKNDPLTTEIAIINLERMDHWNFKFICNKWKMTHNMVLPSYNTVV